MCGEQRRRQVNPTALLGLLPAAVLPAGLRYQVLGLTSDDALDAVEYCHEVARRAEPFNRAGFPVPLDPLAAARGPASFMPAAGVLVAVFAVFGGGAMLAANTLHHPAPPVTSGIAPAPSVTAGTPAPTPSPTASVKGHKKPGAGPGTVPGGTQGYIIGTGTSTATQPAKSGGHSATSIADEDQALDAADPPGQYATDHAGHNSADHAGDYAADYAGHHSADQRHATAGTAAPWAPCWAGSSACCTWSSRAIPTRDHGISVASGGGISAV